MDQISTRHAWVAPDGTLHAVKAYRHSQFSFECFQYENVDRFTWLEADGGAVEKLKACGWARLSNGEWDLPERITASQRATIRQWCQWHDQPLPWSRLGRDFFRAA